MRCNFGLLGNINVIVKFADVMHERRLAPHDDYHLSSIYNYWEGDMGKYSAQGWQYCPTKGSAII